MVSIVKAERKTGMLLSALGLPLRDSVKTGRPTKLTEEARRGVIDFFEDFLTARRDEVCDLLREDYDLEVHPTTVGDYLRSLNITNKRISRINIRRDETLVADFCAQRANFTTHRRWLA